MTMCKTIQPRLTAYLDGDLADEHGSVVRGHLRECAACRQVARDEAALRDGLRELSPVDPPATLWAGVQAQLAAAEVADARKPRWRRAVARWAPWGHWSRWAPTPTMPQLVAGGLVAAAAVAMLTWRAHPAVNDGLPNRSDELAHVVQVPTPGPRHQGPSISVGPVDPAAPADRDVTADLRAEPARITASYDQAIEELMTLAASVRTGWTDEQKTAFDAKVAALRDGITRAAPGRPQQRAQRALIHALQGAILRDDLVLVSGGVR
jgi:Putative zinc-finger